MEVRFAKITSTERSRRTSQSDRGQNLPFEVDYSRKDARNMDMDQDCHTILTNSKKAKTGRDSQEDMAKPSSKKKREKRLQE